MEDYLEGARVDHDRLTRLLGGDDLAWLVDRLARRIEWGRPLTGAVTLPTPSPAQRAAVDRLLGRRPTRGEVLTVSLAAVTAVIVDAGVAPDLAAAVAGLRGPVRDLAGERAADAASWQRAETVLDELADAVPAIADWRAEVRARGLLRRLAGGPAAAYALAVDLRRAVLALPAPDQPRPVFAATVLDDAHALDDGRALTTLVHGAARALAGQPTGKGVEWRRAVWDSVGVLTGDLAAPVLTLGLAPGDRSLTSRLLEAASEAGEPVHVSLRALTRHPAHLGRYSGADVFVCENPTVVAVAADRLGSGCAPLVCGGGQLGGAARLLLRMLAEAGALLRYHGDFDWGGVAIASGVLDRYAAKPWRFDADSYRDAVGRGLGGPLSGRPTSAPWDPALAEAMREHGARVEEEQVLEDLLADLATG